MSKSFNELKDLLNYATPEEKQIMLNDYPELKYDYNEVQDILNYATPEERAHFENKYHDLKPEAGYGEVLFNTPAGALAQTGQSTGGIIRAAEELLGTGTKLGESIADESLMAAGQLAEEMNLQPDTWKNSIYSGASSAAQQVPLIVATGFQPELAPLTLATMGAISGGQRYDEARRENYTPGQALLQGAAYGVAEAAGEYIPLGTLLDKTGVTPKAMATKLIKYIAQEEGSELGTEVMQWATDKLAKDITANKDANYQDLMPRLIETAKATLISAPILGGAGMLANAHFQNRELPNSIQPESIPGNEELKQLGDNLNTIETMTPEQEAELVKQALSENQPEQTQPIEPEPIQQPEAPETDSQAINNITELNNEVQANTQELKQDADEAINILQKTNNEIINEDQFYNLFDKTLNNAITPAETALLNEMAKNILNDETKYNDDIIKVAETIHPEIANKKYFQKRQKYFEDIKNLKQNYDNIIELPNEKLSGETALFKKIGLNTDGKIYRGLKEYAAIEDLLKSGEVRNKNNTDTSWSPDVYARYGFDKNNNIGYVLETNFDKNKFQQNGNKFSSKYYIANQPIKLSDITKIYQIEKVRGVSGDVIGYKEIYNQNAQEPQQATQPIIEQTNTPLATEPPASVSESNENVQPVTQEMPVNDINIHDDIQFKRNVDKNKVTSKLKGRVYNPQLAGAIDVFVNPEDGKTYVWNGHHRLQLAKDNGIENVKVIKSEFENLQQAKEAGLLKNLAEENGEPLDYRNFFKQQTPENKQQAIELLKTKGIDINKGLAEKGYALSNLSDYLTNEYEKGKLTENLASEIGKQLPNETDQNALYNHLKKVYFDNDKTITTNKLKDLIEFAKSAPKQTGEMDLFGDTEETNRLDIKSNISEFILKQIKNNKNLFKKLSNEDLAEAATKIGGMIDTTKATPEQQREALAEFNFKRRMFAVGDPISSALNEATQQVIDGQPEGKVKANVYMAVKKILEEGNNNVEQNINANDLGNSQRPEIIGQNQPGIGEQQQSGNAPTESVAQNSKIEQKAYKIEQIKTVQDLINNQRNIADTRLTSVIDDKTAAINYKGKNYTVTETPAGLKFDEIFQVPPKAKQEGLFEEDKPDAEREQEAAQNTDDLFGEKARQEEIIPTEQELSGIEKMKKSYSATENSQASDYGYNLAEQLNTQKLFEKKFDYAKNSGLRNGNTFIKSLIQGDYQQIITDIQARRTNINDVEIAANTLSELDPSSKNNNDYYLEKIKVQLQPANSVKREITKNTQQNSPQTDTTDDFLNKVAEETGMSFDKEYKPENDIKNDVKLADIWEMPKPEYIEYMKKYLREVDPKLNISGAEFLANNQIGFWFNKLKKQKKIKSSVFRSLASSEKAELLASNPKLKVVSDATYQKEITEKKYPEHTKKTTPKEDNVSNDIVMDEETYLAINGASRQDIGEPALHKNIPENIKQKLVERQAIKDRELIEKRDQLRAEYNQKVAAGELRPPTRTEKLIETANSIGDSEAALAARRLLDKKGIQWKPSEKVFDEKTKENNPIKSQDEIDKMFGYDKEAELQKSRIEARTKTKQEEIQPAAKEYSYQMNARPFGIGAQPKGQIRVEEGGGRHGTIVYDRPLTEKEIYDYELKPVQSENMMVNPQTETATPEIGDKIQWQSPKVKGVSQTLTGEVTDKISDNRWTVNIDGQEYDFNPQKNSDIKVIQKKQTDSIDNNIITDHARVQEIKNSITEGELILKTGKLHGRSLAADELANVKRSVANDKAKIGIKEVSNIDEEKSPKQPQWKYEEYNKWSRSFAKAYTKKQLEAELKKTTKELEKATQSHLQAIALPRTSQRKAHVANNVATLGDKKRALIDALEIHEFYPEHTKNPTPSGDAFYDPNIGEHKTPQHKNLSDTFMGLNRVELVQTAEVILNSTPEVHKRLRGDALGRFSVKDENGKIKLDATKLKEADFQKITEILAHEIGHAVDWKEGEVNNTLKRGNVLGHIAALAKFLKHTLNISIDEQPRFLEAKERRRLKAEAKNEVLADIEDKKNIPPELAVEISLLYQQKVKEYMEENGLVHKDYIANEMAELAQQFLGWTDEQVEAGAKWFYKPSELYANTFGAFLTNPQLLQEYAPTVSEMLYGYLKAKPATLKLYNYFQNKINSGDRYKENLNFLRQRMINADVKQSEEMSKQSEKQGFKDWIMTTFTDRLYPVLKYASIAPGSESSFEIMNKAQKLRSITDICEAHLKSFAPKIAKIIKDNKIDLTDLGLRAFFTRVVEERSKQGIIDITDEQLAKKLNTELESQYSPEQVAAMDEIFKILRDARQPLIDKLSGLGIYGEELVKKLKDNKNYFTFDIVEHYDKAFGQGNAVSGKIQKQIGTLKATANPFISTIIKDIALTRTAIEMDFTKSALNFLGEKGVNVQKAQTVNTERGPKNLSPKTSSNLGLVEVLENGKLKGYYVPKDIAETLNNPSMETSVGLQYLSALNHIPRTLFTSASIGFTVSNAIRDSIGSFLKLPHTLSNFGTFSKLYLREFKNALLNTQSEEKVNNLLSKGIIYGDRPMNFQPDPEITPWENILRKFGLSNMATDFNETNASKYARFLNTLMGTVEYMANPIINLSGRIEKASKIAGYDYLQQAIKDKYGISENEIDFMATELVGTPNAKRKGTFTPYMNNLMLFSNVMLQGYKAHATAYKMNKTEYLTKLATVSAAPVLLMALCATGDDKDWWEKVSPYHKQNYNIIPLYWLGGKQYDKNGKALYLTLPKEELSRAIGSTFWQAINPQNGSLRETLTSMFNVWGGEIPKTAPAITAAVDTLSYARGFNPYDSFRQQYVINQRTFDRQDLETDKAFATYILNLFGMNTLYKIDTTAKKNEQPKDTVDSLSGSGLQSAYGLNVAGRFLKASDAGERSAINDLKKDVKSEQARELDLVDSALNKMYGDNKNAKITPEETAAMRKHPDYRKKQIEKYRNPDRASIKEAPKAIRQEVKKILNF